LGPKPTGEGPSGASLDCGGEGRSPPVCGADPFLTQSPKGNQVTKKPDEILREAILSDPEEGWKRFLSHSGPFVRNLIGRFHLSKEDEEEVFQEVCHTLLKGDSRAIREWNPDICSFSHYLAVVVTRTTISFVRSAFHRYTREKMTVADEEQVAEAFLARLEDPTRSVRQRLQRLEEAEILVGVLDRLVSHKKIREADRQAVILRLYGLGISEIEKILGIPSSTLTSRLTRIKLSLQRALLDAGIRPWDAPD
jgi:RNA polymerase sigma factor (sigma-70 family)